MAFFGSPNAFIGLDIGTSSLKLVELVNRRKRLEVATYAQADMPNLLLHPKDKAEEAIRQLAGLISRMLDEAQVSTDVVVAALPSSIVFSTVLTLPNLTDEEINKAVHFEARDVVPANLEDMVLGWSRVGDQPHMDTDKDTPPSAAAEKQPTAPAAAPASATVPIFMTAAPKDVIARYSQLMEMLKLQLYALEVETFPLVRSLLEPRESALIADIGDLATTFHIIDRGTPRISHTIEFGGHDITLAIAQALNLPQKAAEAQKISQGLSSSAPRDIRVATQTAADKLLQEAKNILERYASEFGQRIQKTVLIGGGANLRDLPNAWSAFLKHKAFVGNPWKGLAYPAKLEPRLAELGPTYGVAVGLALRGLKAHTET